MTAPYTQRQPPDPHRSIEIGAKYQADPEAAYCFAGCPVCAPGHGPRCWQRKTEATFTYRVRELLHTDFRYSLGRFYLVSLVRPDVWQMRAFCMGTTTLDRTKPGKWHTVTGVVTEARLGKLVEP